MDHLRQDEHEKYFFGNSSSEIYFSLEEVLRKTIADMMEACKKVLIEEKVCENTTVIDKEVAELEALYMTKCSKVLFDFKSVLKDIFSIPANAPIYHKSQTNGTYTEEDIETLRQNVKNLEEEILREKRFLAHLRKEKDIMEKLRSVYHITKTKLDKLKNNDSCEGMKEKKIYQKLEDYSKKLVLDGNIHMELAEELGI